MKFDQMSRRYFLQGLGVSLLLPYLPSVMPKAYAQAAGTNIRYFHMMNAFGIGPRYFHTLNENVGLLGQGVYGKSLSDIPGNYSTILGAELNPFKNKVSILRGLHTAPELNNHNTSLSTCCSGRDPNASSNSERTAPIYSYSVDAILSESNKVYPSAVGKQRHVNFCPNDEKYKNYSWTKKNGVAQQLPYTQETAGLLTKFTALGQNGSQPPPSPADNQKQVLLVDKVIDDYRKVRDSARINSADKQRLEAYMALIAQIKLEIDQGSSVPQVACSEPRRESEGSIEAKTRNQINIAVAAMACDLTRVCALTFAIPYDPVHGETHDQKDDERTRTQQIMARHFAYALGQMDSFDLGNGSLLDNSIVYWGNEYGEQTGSSPHRYTNMQCVVAGGANGKFKMGQYIDFRQSGGMLLNNFMVSIFNAMGLGSSDYERDGIVGFGEYNSSKISELKLQQYVSTAEKRKPLPYFYQGNILG